MEPFNYFSTLTVIVQTRLTERLGKPHKGNHEPLVVKGKAGRHPGVNGVSKSVECGTSPLQYSWLCWLGERKGARPVKSRVLVCWWWRFDWSFARLTAPVVAITLVSLSLPPIKSRMEPFWYWLTGLFSKMAVKRSVRYQVTVTPNISLRKFWQPPTNRGEPKNGHKTIYCAYISNSYGNFF